MKKNVKTLISMLLMIMVLVMPISVQAAKSKNFEVKGLQKTYYFGIGTDGQLVGDVISFSIKNRTKNNLNVFSGLDLKGRGPWGQVIYSTIIPESGSMKMPYFDTTPIGAKKTVRATDMAQNVYMAYDTAGACTLNVALVPNNDYYSSIKITPEISINTKVDFLYGPKNLKATSKKGKVTLKYKKAAGATKYAIYRKEKNESTFKKIKTTSAASFTDKTVKKGCEYEYYVNSIRTQSYVKTNGAKAKNTYEVITGMPHVIVTVK